MRSRMAGQSMVEFALVLPVLVALAIGTVNLAAMYRTWQVVDTAAAEGARYAAQCGASTPAQAIADYAASAVGQGGVTVKVDDSATRTESATVRATSVAGEELRSEATVTKVSRKVTASKPVELMGGLATWVASSSHTGISSEVTP